ncbi:MAG TPA: MFS transporter [Alphaproteobacteria bacterium]|nr:MFS transporter [Alphaproteobacteria bacterium]
MPIGFRETMDAAPIGRYQWLVAIMLTCVMVLEGFDFQIAAYSAPTLMADWHLTKPQFAPLLASAMIGMAIGSLIGSWTGDRYGRRSTLVASVAFFGVMTAICATANGPNAFIAYRFLSGLGFGAAFPVATALMGEWMPRRVAGKAISIMSTGIPAGVIGGAAAASWFLPNFGWRHFFTSAGVLGLLFALILLWKMPESPAYLILRGRQRDVHTLFKRAWKRSFGNGVEHFELERRKDSDEGLFGKGYGRVNIGLWIAFLCSSLVTYTIAAWLTVILVAFKLPIATALRGPMTYSSSAIVGALVIGSLIVRFGSRPTMLILSGAAIGSAAAMAIAAYALSPGTPLFATIFLGLVIEGFCIGALIPANLVLAARAYDTGIRSRGIGVMSAIGRVGSILSSFIGGAVLAAAHEGGFFALIAALVALVTIGILIVDRHIPRSGKVVLHQEIAPQARTLTVN